MSTDGRGLVDITHDVVSWVTAQRMSEGLLTLFVRHTSASLLVQENADPVVLRDLDAFFSRLVPESTNLYRHDEEGPDDMPAHIRAALTQTHLGIPLRAGRLVLGAWQALYLYEHRRAAQLRHVALHLLGA